MRLRDPPRRRCVSFFAPRAQCCLDDVLALQEGSTSSMLPAMYARATRDSYANVLIFAQEAARLAGAEAKVAEVQVRQRVAARDGFYLLVLDNVRERRRRSTRRQRCGWMCWLLRACVRGLLPSGARRAGGACVGVRNCVLEGRSGEKGAPARASYVCVGMPASEFKDGRPRMAVWVVPAASLFHCECGMRRRGQRPARRSPRPRPRMKLCRRPLRPRLRLRWGRLMSLVGGAAHVGQSCSRACLAACALVPAGCNCSCCTIAGSSPRSFTSR